MKKHVQILSAVLAVLMVSSFWACSQDLSISDGTGTTSNSGTSQGTDTTPDTEPLPPLGDLNVAIIKTPLDPDMSAFVAVPESLSLQEKPSKILTDYSTTKKTYNGAICVVANSSNVWVKDGKYTSDYKFIWDGTHILGPAPTAVAKVNNRYRYRMIIKCRNNKNFRNMLKTAIDIKLVNDVTVSVDMNPETVI